ncbi:hypothetical protein ACJ41O_005748 [Fusarium nematophilum]
MLRLRLASLRLSHIALPWAYKTFLLETHNNSADRFIQIAKSPKLRNLVREVTIDTWIGPGFEYNTDDRYEFPTAFMDALPYLHCFTKVTTYTCGSSYDFRYRVLDTVCHCAAGIWTLERQIEIDEEAAVYDEDPQYPEDDSNGRLGQVMPLSEFTIANLADYDDPNNRASKAWQKVLSLPSLVDLKLFIATETISAAPESAVCFPEKYELFEGLSRSWLRPGLADNLKVLSLYFRDYWGWFPKMDCRLIGGDLPFPKLKVLALGNYVFSHNWQIDWFATVGQENGSGGLEELYLDDCPILFKANQAGPFDAKDAGYPVTSIVMQQRSTYEVHEYSLRWHHILSRWAVTMKALKVCRLGHGSWDGRAHDTFNTITRDPDYADVDRRILDYRIAHQAHRVFACPEPTREKDSPEVREWTLDSGKYFDGTGIQVDVESRAQYIEYDIGVGPSQ